MTSRLIRSYCRALEPAEDLRGVEFDPPLQGLSQARNLAGPLGLAAVAVARHGGGGVWQ